MTSPNQAKADPMQGLAKYLRTQARMEDMSNDLADWLRECADAVSRSQSAVQDAGKVPAVTPDQACVQGWFAALSDAYHGKDVHPHTREKLMEIHLYLAGAPSAAGSEGADRDALEAVAFEATNETPSTPLLRYWWRKGFDTAIAARSTPAPEPIKSSVPEIPDNSFDAPAPEGQGVAAKFDKTYCSQCGGEFGPGDAGYSHCSDHRTCVPSIWEQRLRWLLDQAWIQEEVGFRLGLSGVEDGADWLAEYLNAIDARLPKNTESIDSPSEWAVLSALDEIECDLPHLFGRASKEGHEVGQRLAQEVRVKMRAALAASQPREDVGGVPDDKGGA